MLKIFQWMYDKALTWAKHRHAERSLEGFSDKGSVMFLSPPDEMLVPIALADPNKANVITIASLLGWFGWETVALGGVSY